MSGGTSGSGVGRTRLLGCSLCHYRTDRKNNLKRHTLTMHQMSGTAGDCCGLAFFSKGELRAHTQSCHRDGYHCGVCGHPFTRKALLRRHLSVHTGIREFSCPLCAYQSSNKSNVERHLRVHQRQWGATRPCPPTPVPSLPLLPLPPTETSSQSLLPQQYSCPLASSHLQLLLTDGETCSHSKALPRPGLTLTKQDPPRAPKSSAPTKTSRRGFTVEELLSNNSEDERTSLSSTHQLSPGVSEVTGISQQVPMSLFAQCKTPTPRGGSFLFNVESSYHSQHPSVPREAPSVSSHLLPEFRPRRPEDTPSIVMNPKCRRYPWPVWPCPSPRKVEHTGAKVPADSRSPGKESIWHPLSCHTHTVPPSRPSQTRQHHPQRQEPMDVAIRTRLQGNEDAYVPKKLRACKRYQKVVTAT